MSKNKDRRNTPKKDPVKKVIAARKNLKKQLERETGKVLAWIDGHLFATHDKFGNRYDTPISVHSLIGIDPRCPKPANTSNFARK